MKCLTISALFCFLFISFFADAILLRNGGRGAISNNSATFVALIPDSEIINNFVRSSYLSSLRAFDQETMEGGSERIYTVPSECYSFFSDQTSLDEFEARNSPCEWSFNEGDALELFGFMDHYMANSVNQSITWTITDANGLDYIFKEPEVSLVDGIETQIFLNASMPDTLTAGEYEVRARSEQFAPDGFSFYQYFFVTPEQCFNNDPIFGSECFRSVEKLNDAFINTSASTRMTVIAANSPSVALFFAVFAISSLWRRRGH